MDTRESLTVALSSRGYPEEFALLLASELRSDNAIMRLAGYVRGARPQSMEEIVDEMLTIRDLNESWRQRKIAEHAQAQMTRFYNRVREDDEDE
jgi:hypothetical protein